MKTKLMAGASALTLVMFAPGVAHAVVPTSCGVPNTSADPNVASCISDSTDFANGISYDQTTYGTPANLKIDIYGTAVVNATGTTTAVTINGSVNHDALIGVRNGAKITGTQIGLQAQTSGTGNADIMNHGTVNSGALGAVAGAMGTGSATITNAIDGTVTVTQASGGSATIGAGLAITGTNGSIINQGKVTVNSAGSGQFFGLGAYGLGGGTLTATNSNLVTVTTDAADAVGIGSLPSAGNFVLANNGTLTVSSNTGSATGLAVTGSSAGTSTLTNTGALSVTSTSGNATGMSVDQGTDVTMAATRANAASTFTVSGADATGFAVTNATGAVSVTGSGQSVGVTGTTSATGVSVDGGTTQTVAFAPATVGGTAYSGDLKVSAAGDASGVVLSGASDAVSVGFTGASLSVTSTAGGATGIQVTDGSSVDIAVSGTGAALTVSAAGGDATGVSTSGASGAQDVSFGNRLSVTNSAGTATGISLADGTDQTASLTNGATVSGSADATGISLAGGTGALAVTAGNGLTVTSTAGIATGVSLADGTDQTVTLTNGAAVAGSADATGISLAGGTGALTVTAGNGLNVTSTTGIATGLTLADGTAQTVTLANGATVVGAGGAMGVSLEGGSGALAVTSTGTLAIDGGAGEGSGVFLNDGASQTVTLNGALTVSGADATYGVQAQGSQGNVSINAADAFAVTSTGNTAIGVAASGDGDVAVNFAKGLNVQGGTYAAGAFVGGGGALSLTSADDFSVTAGTDLVFGTYMMGGTSQDARFEGDLVVSSSGGGFGILQVDATGPVSLTVAGDFTGTELEQGFVQSEGTAQSIDLGGAFALTGATGDIVGVQQSAASDSSSLEVTGTFTVAATGGSATGVTLDGNDAAVSLAKGMTVSANGADATGLTATLSGDAQFTIGGALSVTNDPASAGGSATGLSVGTTGAQDIALSGAVTVSADGTATGFDLTGDTGTIELAASAPVTVTSASGDALGLSIDGGTDQTATLSGLLTVNGAGSAVGVAFADGTGTAGLDLAAGLKVTSSTADAIGIQATDGAALAIDAGSDVTVSAASDAIGVQSTGFTGAQNVQLGNVTVSATGGEALGVDLSGSGAITLADAGSVAVTGVGGTGVSVTGTGSNGAISVSLANVQTAGEDVVGVNLAQTGTGSSGAITASLGTVATIGAGATGVTVQGSQSGTTSLTVGASTAAAARSTGTVTAAAAATTGGVSTQGDNANGVTFAVIDGAGTVTNLGMISTTGANSLGIAASATGTGSIAVNSATVTTTGAGSDGVSVQTGSGVQTLALTSVAVTGAGSRGVVATSGSGAIALSSGSVSAARGDAVVLTSTSGNVSATLASGGATVSKTGAGLAITTGGTASVTQGSTATLQGATYGLVSNATGGQTIVLSGTVGADSNHAVALSGGAATLTNNGTINGFMTFDTASTALTNAGTWNAQGGNSTFAGNATLTNSGTLNVNAAAAAAATMKLTGLTTLRNSGTISLVNGHTGDVLDLGNAAFVGSGNSRVVLEANLGSTAVGASAAQSADQLTVGAVTGTTTISIKDLSGATGAKFNFDGIRLVNAASVANGAFVLEGGAVNKGFVDYQLVTDAAGNLDLVGVPSTQAFELVRTGAEVRHYWRRSGDAWSEQMRALSPQQGIALWGQVLGGSETNRSRPLYSATVLGTATSFAPNLDVRDSWFGGQFGLDWGRSAANGTGWGLGVTGGYVSQDGKVKSTGDKIKLSGGNVGLYARYRSEDGLFAHALAKLDRYSLKYDLGNGASAPKSNGTSYGVEIEAGYHIRAGTMFIEPSASASWTDADLDGFAATGGVGAKFDHVQSFYGRGGVRAGIETQSGDWALQPYVGVNYEGELNGRPGATLSSGGEDLYFRDASEGGRARWEAGIQGSSQGLSAFAKVEGVTGSGSSGVAGRAGVAIRW